MFFNVLAVAKLADDERIGHAARKCVRGEKGEVSRPHTCTAAVHHATGSHQLPSRTNSMCAVVSSLSCWCWCCYCLFLLCFPIAATDFELYIICALRRRVEHRIFRFHHVDMNKNLKLSQNFKSALSQESLQTCARNLINKKKQKVWISQTP